MISHTAYFGDGEKTFALTDPMIEELQHKTGVGIGALFLRMTVSQFHGSDMEHVIRLALIGGGTNPAEAQRLVDAYAKNRPFDETFPLALDILDARWNGKPDNSEDEGLREVAE
ncbi:gene transfer agent family protein [Rhizobium leguminosarum]|uniref:gene transfer agent family protein n=1 Tax=Rhizobium laguerreae TaxID=1076926 RepID=UPI001C9132D9|nr:gene transfer agent family protein [Rhizobium laguerreae]MBY3070756.1 gene transfer agent family protein [Rhizobium laguerreae]